MRITDWEDQPSKSLVKNPLNIYHDALSQKTLAEKGPGAFFGARGKSPLLTIQDFKSDWSKFVRGESEEQGGSGGK